MARNLGYDPVTAEQRTEILGHFDAGLDNRTITEKMGLYPAQVRGVRAHWSQGHYRLPADDEAAEAAIETTFGLERDLQRELHGNIGQLDPVLTIVAKEYVVASGRIDLLCEEPGGLVPIELKAGVCDHNAVSQLLSYMGDLMAAGTPAQRGIIIAGEFTPRTIAAARAVPSIELRRYAVQFSFKSAE